MRELAVQVSVRAYVKSSVTPFFQFCVSAHTKLWRVNDKSRLSLPPVRRERPPPSKRTYDRHAALSAHLVFCWRGRVKGGNHPAVNTIHLTLPALSSLFKM